MPPEMSPQLAVDSFITSFRRFLEVAERNEDQVMLRKTREIQTKDKDYFWLRRVLPIGPYLFDSSAKKLYQGNSRKEVPLSEEELSQINELFKARGFGQTAFPVDRPEFRTESFQALLKKLELKL